MASRKEKEKAKAALSRLMSDPGDPGHMSDDILGKLEKQYDDPAVAIMFAAFVENALEAAILGHFVIGPEKGARLFSYPENEGILATFAAKIALGEALGVFDGKMKSDLLLIKDIRNAFSHSRIGVTFENEAIGLACDLFYKHIHFLVNRDEEIYLGTNRQQYTVLCMKLRLYLTSDSPNPLRYDKSERYANFYP